MGQFAKNCQKSKKSLPQSLQSPQMKINQIDTINTKSDDKESVIYITSYQQFYDQVYESNYVISNPITQKSNMNKSSQTRWLTLSMRVV